jgi:hypothetical protein
MSTLSWNDVHKAYAAGRILMSSETAKLLPQLLMLNDVEQFVFGRLAPPVITDMAEDMVEFVNEDLFVLPFQDVIYRVVAEAGNSDDTDANITMFATRNCVKEGMIIFVGISELSDGTVLAIKGAMFATKNNFSSDKIVVSGTSAETAFVKNCNLPKGIILNFGLILAGLTGILNTKNVPKARTAPSAKKNARLVKQGLPPLPYTTTVDTSGYVASYLAGNGTPHGTHASPRPHLRRAHLRHMPHGLVPVSACVVNWTGGVLSQREEYQVK